MNDGRAVDPGSLLTGRGATSGTSSGAVHFIWTLP